MKSRLSFPFAVLMVLLAGFGGFILLLSIWMWIDFFRWRWIDFFRIDRTNAGWLLLPGLMGAMGGIFLWLAWRSLTRLEIDPLTATITIKPLFWKSSRYEKPQILGYSLRSEWTKLGDVKVFYLHVVGRKPFWFIAWAMRNFMEMRALVISLYSPMTPPPIRKRRPLSHSEEVRRRLTKAPKGK